MHISKIRTEARIIDERFWNRSKKLDLFYVCCFWTDPISEELSYRIGYFEHVIEAQKFAEMLRTTYIEMNVPFYICSNVDSCKVDSGLFDDVK